jgi:hypothetical protein
MSEFVALHPELLVSCGKKIPGQYQGPERSVGDATAEVVRGLPRASEHTFPDMGDDLGCKRSSAGTQVPLQHGRYVSRDELLQQHAPPSSEQPLQGRTHSWTLHAMPTRNGLGRQVFFPNLPSSGFPLFSLFILGRIAKVRALNMLRWIENCVVV